MNDNDNMTDNTDDRIDELAAEWQAAKIVGTEEEATLAVGFLNSNGIEAQVESLRSSELPADIGHLGEVHVMVPAEQLAEAQRLLAQSEADAAGRPADREEE
jgi:Putative prokaryotic signal transducing protein